jgi:hypothetical protein
VIVFDLKCAAAHVFEAWFGSSDDYEDQRARRLVACPLCGNCEVTKAVMAPRLGSGVVEPATSPVAAAPTDEAKAAMAALARLQAKLLARSEWVGPRFAAEARAMHHGEADARQIHGQATPAEAAALAEEGVPLLPLPLPVLPPEQTH